MGAIHIHQSFIVLFETAILIGSQSLPVYPGSHPCVHTSTVWSHVLWSLPQVTLQLCFAPESVPFIFTFLYKTRNRDVDMKKKTILSRNRNDF